jgi:hypothetical protein
MVNYDDGRITSDVPCLSSVKEGRRAGRPWLRRLQPIDGESIRWLGYSQ